MTDQANRTTTESTEPASAVRREWRRTMLKWMLALLAGYLVWLVMLWLFQERLIFPGMMMRRDGDSAPRPTDAEVFWIERDRTRVEAWLLPAERPAPGRPLVVYAHGNAELIDDMAFMLEPYRRLGLAVLLVEYPGFARSKGLPTEAGIVDDFEAALERVLADGRIDPERVIYHGRSIGGAVLAQLAGRRAPRAMILESTFFNLGEFTARYLAPRSLLRHPFATDAIVRDFDRPLLLLHGERDEIIPFDHARRLHALAPHSRLAAFPSGHNDFPIDSLEYWREIRSFLQAVEVLE